MALWAQVAECFDIHFSSMLTFLDPFLSAQRGGAKGRDPSLPLSEKSCIGKQKIVRNVGRERDKKY